MRDLFLVTLYLSILSIALSEENISQDDTLHINTNDFLAEKEAVNETLTPNSPELSVTIDYENPDIKNKDAEPVKTENYENTNGEKYLALDSYSLHISGLHPQEKFPAL